MQKAVLIRFYVNLAVIYHTEHHSKNLALNVRQSMTWKVLKTSLMVGNPKEQYLVVVLNLALNVLQSMTEKQKTKQAGKRKLALLLGKRVLKDQTQNLVAILTTKGKDILVADFAKSVLRAVFFNREKQKALSISGSAFLVIQRGYQMLSPNMPALLNICKSKRSSGLFFL